MKLWHKMKHTLLVCPGKCLRLANNRLEKDVGRMSLVILVILECSSDPSSHEARTGAENKKV